MRSTLEFELEADAERPLYIQNGVACRGELLPSSFLLSALFPTRVSPVGKRFTKVLGLPLTRTSYPSKNKINVRFLMSSGVAFKTPTTKSLNAHSLSKNHEMWTQTANGKSLAYPMILADLSTAWPRIETADCVSQPCICMPKISCILPAKQVKGVEDTRSKRVLRQGITVCVDQQAPSEPPVASWFTEPWILA